MNTLSKKSRCPLCNSLLTQAKFGEIIGRWEEIARLEKNLKERLQTLQHEKQKLLIQKKAIKAQMKKQMKQAVKNASERATKKEKARADRLSRMIQGKAQQIQNLNKKVKELQEQLKKGTTPQVEGLNLEEELVKELRREFTPEDKIEHHGRNGDVLQRVNFRQKQVGAILYECKKHTDFKPAFIDQAKRAAALRQATYGVLVTTCFKKDTAGFWVEKDILIVHPFGAVYVAGFLRKKIIEIHSLKISRMEMEKRSRELLGYIKSDEFKNCVEDSIYRTRFLYEMLKKEMRGHKKIWDDRFKHYRTIHDNMNRLDLATSNILKGLPAKDALTQLKQLPPLEIRC